MMWPLRTVRPHLDPNFHPVAVPRRCLRRKLMGSSECKKVPSSHLRQISHTYRLLLLIPS